MKRVIIVSTMFILLFSACESTPTGPYEQKKRRWERRQPITRDSNAEGNREGIQANDTDVVTSGFENDRLDKAAD